MILRVLDPTNETAPPLGEPAPRLDTLAEKTVGFAVADVVTRVKSNFSAPADPHIVAEIGSWDAVVTGIGD